MFMVPVCLEVTFRLRYLGGCPAVAASSNEKGWEGELGFIQEDYV